MPPAKTTTAATATASTRQNADTSGLGRRSQPARQARTNTSKSALHRDHQQQSSTAGFAGDQPIASFPATSNFTDVQAAIPKEIVRHLTLFKEVDAKIYNQEQEMANLSRLAQREIAPQHAVPSHLAQNMFSFIIHWRRSHGSPVYEKLLHNLSSMIAALEEKNHVVTTANEALDKEMSRVNNVLPELHGEFTNEAKYGNPNHWAYPDNRSGSGTHSSSSNVNGGNNKAAQAERARREAAAVAAVPAAIPGPADEAAARSDARKQAMLAKRSLKALQQAQAASEAETSASKSNRAETTKKTGTQGKVRKTAADHTPVSTAAGGNPAKRRKVEKAPAQSNLTANPALGVLANAAATDMRSSLSTSSAAVGNLTKIDKKKATASATIDRTMEKDIPVDQPGPDNDGLSIPSVTEHAAASSLSSAADLSKKKRPLTASLKAKTKA